MDIYLNLYYVLPAFDAVVVITMGFIVSFTYTVATYAIERSSREYYYLLDHVKKNKASLKRLLQSLSDGVIVYHKDEIVYWNQAMQGLITDIDCEFLLKSSEPVEKSVRKDFFKCSVLLHRFLINHNIIVQEV